MTDNEIIQAFEACYTNKYTDCDECPYYCRKENRCVDMIVDGVPTLPKNILDLINRLKAENEKLVNIPPKDPMDFCGVVCNYAEELIEKAKSEAYKEFAEACKACFPSLSKVFDIILKEMG